MKLRAALLLATALPTPLLAQTPPESSPPPAGTTPAAQAETRVFTPADFERFAPRTAFDMLVQLPGFTIREADNERGLGQASENVLINGQRVTDKSGGAVAQLRNVPAADVEKIEIVEAATLGIPGLTGQVANVILKAERKPSGNFEWSPAVRPHYAQAAALRASASYSGTSGDLGYTLSLQNTGGRGAIGGNNYAVTDPRGAVTERRDQVLHNEYDDLKTSLLLKYGGKGPVQANLNLSYDPYWSNQSNAQRRYSNGNPNDWSTQGQTEGYVFEASGDIAFKAGPGTLKLIGLQRTEHAPYVVVQRSIYDSGAPSTGTRFGRDSHLDESVVRAEYRWKTGKSDWQLSFERAFNELDQKGSLASLAPDGSFTDIPFPQGSGVVAEVRYESLLSFGRPLASNLDLQLVGGAEYSTLEQLDRADSTRNFFRPKGSGSLAWRPAKKWDFSLKLERRVGQISFYDFLAQQDLVLARESDANPELVPPQSWELTAEGGHDFSHWGKLRLRGYSYWIEDIVDNIPVGIDGEAVGNLPKASRLGVEATGTLLFDPIGWKGAKLDMTLGAERSRVEDPLTGADRQISGTHDRWATFDLRHDIPKSQFAWGGGFYFDHFTWNWYLTEMNRSWEGPYASLFVEHKNVAGLKLRLSAFNLNDGRNKFDRIVFAGRRNVAPVAFREHARQLIGPIFTFSVKGTF